MQEDAKNEEKNKRHSEFWANFNTSFTTCGAEADDEDDNGEEKLVYVIESDDEEYDAAYVSYTVNVVAEAAVDAEADEAKSKFWRDNVEKTSSDVDEYETD